MESQPQPQPQTETRAPAQNIPPMPTRATEEDVQAILKGPALNHLAPVPGGKWRVLSRTMNAIEVAYVVNHTQILAITVQLGANPALVTDQCWQHVYGYPTGKRLSSFMLSPTFGLTTKRCGFTCRWRSARVGTTCFECWKPCWRDGVSYSDVQPGAGRE